MKRFAVLFVLLTACYSEAEYSPGPIPVQAEVCEVQLDCEGYIPGGEAGSVNCFENGEDDRCLFVCADPWGNYVGCETGTCQWAAWPDWWVCWPPL